MAMLEIPGSFTMLVPDGHGWGVTQHGTTYELTKPGDESSLHISEFERGGSALGDDEAVQGPRRSRSWPFWCCGAIDS